MHGFWGVFWLAVILKIPIVALLWLVWYAVRQPPVPEAEQDDSGGSRRGAHPRTPPPPAPAARWPARGAAARSARARARDASRAARARSELGARLLLGLAALPS